LSLSEEEVYPRVHFLPPGGGGLRWGELDLEFDLVVVIAGLTRNDELKGI